MSEFTRKYGIEYSEDNYRISFRYRGDETDVDKIFTNVLLEFGNNNLIKQFKYDNKNNKVLNSIIEDVKNKYLRDGYEQIVKYFEKGRFEMYVSIYATEDTNYTGLQKRVLKFVEDIIDVLNGEKSVDDVKGFDVEAEVEVEVSFVYDQSKSVKPILVYKDDSHDEKLHIGLTDVKVEKDKYSPYTYVTLLLSVELL